MNCFTKYFMPCIAGILGKKGVNLTHSFITPNMFLLSSFAKGNVTTRRIAGNTVRTPMVHRSRIMGGY